MAYYTANKSQVKDRIFKLTLIHEWMIYLVGWIQWKFFSNLGITLLIGMKGSPHCIGLKWFCIHACSRSTCKWSTLRWGRGKVPMSHLMGEGRWVSHHQMKGIKILKIIWNLSTKGKFAKYFELKSDQIRPFWKFHDWWEGNHIWWRSKN